MMLLIKFYMKKWGLCLKLFKRIIIINQINILMFIVFQNK